MNWQYPAFYKKIFPGAKFYCHAERKKDPYGPFFNLVMIVVVVALLIAC